MSKKDFKGSFGDLLGGKGKEPAMREDTSKPSATHPKEEKKEIRATFIVDSELLDKIKAISYWERTQIKDSVHHAFSSFIDNYEKEHGKVKSIPQR